MWTSVCSKAFYERYIRMHQDRFAEGTVDRIQAQLRQSSLAEYAGLEA